MPIHQYKCLACGHQFQKLLPVGHHPEKCLECGHPEVQKQIAAPGVIFKGGGFYKTDSQKPRSGPVSSPSKPKEDQKSSSAEASGSEKASDSAKASSDTSSDKPADKHPSAPAAPGRDRPSAKNA